MLQRQPVVSKEDISQFFGPNEEKTHLCISPVMAGLVKQAINELNVQDMERYVVECPALLVLPLDDECHATALMLAIQNDADDIAEFLIHAGARLHYKDNHGYNAFSYTCMLQKEKLSRLLIDVIDIPAGLQELKENIATRCDHFPDNDAFYHQCKAIWAIAYEQLNRASQDLNAELPVLLDLYATVKTIDKILISSLDELTLTEKVRQFFAVREDLLRGDGLDYCYGFTPANQFCCQVAQIVFPDEHPANVLLKQATTESRVWKNFITMETDLPDSPHDYFRTSSNCIHLYEYVVMQAIESLRRGEKDLAVIWRGSDVVLEEKYNNKALSEVDLAIISQRTPTLGELVSYTKKLNGSLQDTIYARISRLRTGLLLSDAHNNGTELFADTAAYNFIIEFCTWWNELGQNPGGQEIQKKILAVTNDNVTLGDVITVLVNKEQRDIYVLYSEKNGKTFKRPYYLFLRNPTKLFHVNKMGNKTELVITAEDKKIFLNKVHEEKIDVTKPLHQQTTIQNHPELMGKLNEIIIKNQGHDDRADVVTCTYLLGQKLDVLLSSDRVKQELHAIDGTVNIYKSDTELKQIEQKILTELAELPPIFLLKSRFFVYCGNKIKKFMSAFVKHDAFSYEMFLDFDALVGIYNQVRLPELHLEAVINNVFLIKSLASLSVLSMQEWHPNLSAIIHLRLYSMLDNNENISAEEIKKMVPEFGSFESWFNSLSDAIIRSFLLCSAKKNEMALVGKLLNSLQTNAFFVEKLDDLGFYLKAFSRNKSSAGLIILFLKKLSWIQAVDFWKRLDFEWITNWLSHDDQIELIDTVCQKFNIVQSYLVIPMKDGVSILNLILRNNLLTRAEKLIVADICISEPSANRLLIDAITNASVTPDTLRWLLFSEKLKFDVNCEWQGKTPLIIAVECGNLAKVKLLLSRKDIDLSRTNQMEYTAVEIAVYQEKEAIVRCCVVDEVIISVLLRLKNDIFSAADRLSRLIAESNSAQVNQMLKKISCLVGPGTFLKLLASLHQHWDVKQFISDYHADIVSRISWSDLDAAIMLSAVRKNKHVTDVLKKEKRSREYQEQFMHSFYNPNEKSLIDRLYEDPSTILYYLQSLRQYAEKQADVAHFEELCLLIWINLPKFANASELKDIMYYLVKTVPDLALQRKHALHFFAKENRVDIVDIFIELGIDIKNENEDKLTPLEIAAKAGASAVVETLVHDDPSGIERALLQAVYANQHSIINFLLRFANNWNGRQALYNYQNLLVRTVGHQEVNLDTFRLLLHGCPLNYMNYLPDGRSLTMVAAERNDITKLRVLLEYPKIAIPPKQIILNYSDEVQKQFAIMESIRDIEYYIFEKKNQINRGKGKTCLFWCAGRTEMKIRTAQDIKRAIESEEMGFFVKKPKGVKGVSLNRIFEDVQKNVMKIGSKK